MMSRMLGSDELPHLEIKMNMMLLMVGALGPRMAVGLGLGKSNLNLKLLIMKSIVIAKKKKIVPKTLMKLKNLKEEKMSLRLLKLTFLVKRTK